MSSNWQIDFRVEGTFASYTLMKRTQAECLKAYVLFLESFVDGFYLGVHLEFDVNIPNMGTNGITADKKFFGNFFIAVSF